MISAQGHTAFSTIRYQGKRVIAKYYGTHLVWEEVRSCYGKGVWIEEKPWIDNDTWKNNR